MQDLTEMRPVVANPNITFATLLEELAEATGTPVADTPLAYTGFAEEQEPFLGPPGVTPKAVDLKAEQARWLVSQIIAKLHRKKRRLSGSGAQRFRDLAGTIAASIIGYVRQAALGDPLVSYMAGADRASVENRGGCR
jgi:type I restriction enzyme R subunit